MRFAKSALHALSFALLLSAPLAPAQATLGLFEHGNGIASMGMGGVSYSTAFETTALSANPAHALALGNRYDVGVDLFWAKAVASYEGNAAGPDESYASDGKSYYAIPQGGYSRRVSDRMAWGVTVLSAGLGPSYDGSPYERFGGNRRVQLSLASSSVVTALSYQLNPHNTVGLGLSVGYQEFSVEGLEFLANEQSSVAPDKVTNQGKDGVFTGALSIGWLNQVRPWLTVGAGYRTRNWNAKHEEYRGLIAEGGRLELPAIYGLGVTLKPAARWTVALEAQRFEYRRQRAFRNGIAPFVQGERLGADQGPGFGFDNQNAYKLGVSFQATPALVLRAGYIETNTVAQESETLFGVLGCLTANDNYTAGATWTVRDWEFTGMAAHMPKKFARGRNSIPPELPLGGGEIDISDEVIAVGVSLGRRF
jgi:long-chain fatty acid transport protein